MIHLSRIWVWHLFLGGKENVSLAEALNQARLPVIDYKTCRQKKFWGDRVRDSMICAGFRDTEGTPAACQVRKLFNGEMYHGAPYSTLFIPSLWLFFLKGDSGGPLLCQVGRDRWEVHGIVSFGPIGCTVENKPSVFTRTAAYIPWIEATRIRDFFLHWIPTSKNYLPTFVGTGRVVKATDLVPCPGLGLAHGPAYPFVVRALWAGVHHCNHQPPS